MENPVLKQIDMFIKDDIKHLSIVQYRKFIKLIRQQKELQLEIYHKYYEIEKAVLQRARKDGHSNL